MSTYKVFKISRILVITLSLISAEAQAIGLGGTRMLVPQGANCDNGTSFSSLLKKVNIFSDNGQDPRVIQSRTGDGKMFAPIGIIATNNPVPSTDPKDVDPTTGARLLKKGRATSFLISPCYALTNYHAVFGASDAPTDKFTATFYDFDPEAKAYKQTRATPVAWGGYGKSGKSADDWALVKLDICVGKRIGWLETSVRKTDELYNKEVAMAGYPGDKKVSDLWMHASCRLAEYNIKNYDGTFFTDCASRPGSSGSPLFDLENGYPQVLALHRADLNADNSILHDYKRDKANVAIDIRVILPKINQIISDDKMTFGGKNPSLPAEVLAATNQSSI